MLCTHLKNGEQNSPIWNGHFWNRTWPRSRPLFSLNKSLTSAVLFICPQTDLLIIWDLMLVNNRWIILHRSFHSKLQLIRIILSDKISGSTVGLKSYMRVHRANVNAQSFFLGGGRSAAELANMNTTWGVKCAPTDTSCWNDMIAFFCKCVYHPKKHNLILKHSLAQSTGPAEYTDCLNAEG